jgi:hypothetical protein
VPQFVSAMPPATVKICTNCAREAVYKAPWRTQPPGHHQRWLGSCSDLIASSGGLIIYAEGKTIGRSPYSNLATPSIPLCASPSLSELRPSIVICHSCRSCMYKAPPADMLQLCRPSLAGRHGHASPAQDGEEASIIYRLPSPMASKLDILFTFTSSGTCRPSSIFCTYRPP